MTASKDLCEKLFKLSGWDDTYFSYGNNNPSLANPGKLVITNSYEVAVGGETFVQLAESRALILLLDKLIPAYDLRYLLRKLPNMLLENEDGVVLSVTSDALKPGKEEFIIKKHRIEPFGLIHTEDGRWMAVYEGYYWGTADDPTDAACLLAIKLFEEGIL